MLSSIELIKKHLFKIKKKSWRELLAGKSNTGKSVHFLENQIKKYRVENLKKQTPREFKEKIQQFLETVDGEMEGFNDYEYQRDLSIKFHWGHNHDFGEFSLKGEMEDRHIKLIATFMDKFGVLPENLSGKKILDIGCWTGGTSLILCAMGAEVVAIEEVKKYVDALNYLKYAFDISNLEVKNISLYDIPSDFYDQFDYVFFAGVIYHLSDPIIACRITYNCLKDGGCLLMETQSVNSSKSILLYEGPGVFIKGSRKNLSRTGWNWFSPSPSTVVRMLKDVGYAGVKVDHVVNGRLHAVAQKEKQVDIMRSGLSKRNIR